MTKYHYPALAVDVIIEQDDRLLLIKRKNEPFKYLYALPGGFVNEYELVEAAAVREIREETSVDIILIDILGVYSKPNRDPRGHVISVVFVGKITGGVPKAGDDAGSYEWLRMDDLTDIKVAFDHINILDDYSRWKLSKGTYWSSKQQ